MIGKKINQLATELAPVSTDLTIIGDPTTGVSKKITLAQLGAIFSGAVSFYTNLAGFPATGDINVIYCAKDTQKLYLWSGSAYTEVFPSQALLDTYQLRSEKGNANGYASLDSSGKVPVSQLPSSIMEYKGTWNAATNTPTLANGTGDTGDVYICNVAGTVNFGAGPLTFAVGDYVIYSGTIWQRSSGAVGTVTSVAVSRSGDALAITGSPITTSGTINLGFAGNSTQYINGAGNLVTFPGIINEAQNLITEVYNKTGATLTKGTVVYINGGQGNLPAVTKALATGDSTSAQTYGIVRNDITNNNNGYVVVAGRISDLDTQAYTEGTQLYLSPTTAGTYTSTKPYAPQHLVYVGIVVRAHPTQGVVEVKIQNGYELDELHNVAAQTPTNNDGIFYNSATSLWEKKSIATVLGYTPQAQLNGTGFVKATGTTISYDNSTYVTTDTFQTISASKTFSVGLSLASAGGTNQLTSFVNTSSLFSGSAGSNVLGFNSANNIYFGKGSNNGGVIQWNNSTVRYYTLPDATGTIALTSDIPSLTGYVPYTGATANVNLGTNDLLSRSVYIEGTASYQAGLLMRQISGFNFVTGAYTQVVPSGIYDLYVVHNQTNGTRRRYAISVAALQDNDSFQYLVPRKDGTFAMTSDIPSLTGYVQGTGTTNYLPKFTGTSTIGNSALQETSGNIQLDNTSAVYIANSSSTSYYGGLSIRQSGTERARFAANSDEGAYIYSPTFAGFSILSNAGTFLRLNASGNLGLGVTPSAWSSPFIAFQLGTFNQYIAGQTNAADMKLGTNHYYGSGDYRYGNSTDRAARYDIGKDGFFWQIAPSGTAGNAISFTQAMTLDASGRLGIGTTSPSELLDVRNSYREPTSGEFTQILSSTTTQDAGRGGSLGFGGFTNGTSGYTTFSGIKGFKENGDGGNTAGALAFYTRVNGGAINERMRITSGGNVGIGTTAPSRLFHAAGQGRFDGNLLISADAGNEQLVIQRGSNNNAQLIIGYHSSGYGRIQAVEQNVGYKALALNQDGGNVGIGTTSPVSNANRSTLALQGAWGGQLDIMVGSTVHAQFGTDNFNSGLSCRIQSQDGIVFNAGGATERMRINSSGNLGVGTTTSVANYRMDITGPQGAIWARCDNPGDAQYLSQSATIGFHYYALTSAGPVYYVSNNGDVRNANNSYGAISDISLKENIVDATPKLDDLLKVKIRSYNLIADENKEKQIGVIAQELEEIFPNMISNDKQLGTDKTIKTVKYSVFVPMLIKAVQELKAELDTLKNK